MEKENSNNFKKIIIFISFEFLMVVLVGIALFMFHAEKESIEDLYV